METDHPVPDVPLIAPIEPYIAELAMSPHLPMFAVALCTLRYPASGPLLRAALERAADGKLVDGDDELLFFRALHIVGGRRDPLGFDRAFAHPASSERRTRGSARRRHHRNACPVSRSAFSTATRRPCSTQSSNLRLDEYVTTRLR